MFRSKTKAGKCSSVLLSGAKRWCQCLLCDAASVTGHTLIRRSFPLLPSVGMKLRIDHKNKEISLHWCFAFNCFTGFICKTGML